MTKILGGVTTVLGLAVLALALLLARGPKPEARGDEAVLKVQAEPVPAAAKATRGEKAGGEEQKADASPSTATGIDKLLEAGDPDEVTKAVVFRRARAVGKTGRVIILEVRGEVMPFVAFKRDIFPKDFGYGKPYKVVGKVTQYQGADQFQISKFVQ